MILTAIIVCILIYNNMYKEETDNAKKKPKPRYTIAPLQKNTAKLQQQGPCQYGMLAHSWAIDHMLSDDICERLAAQDILNGKTELSSTTHIWARAKALNGTFEEQRVANDILNKNNYKL